MRKYINKTVRAKVVGVLVVASLLFSITPVLASDDGSSFRDRQDRFFFDRFDRFDRFDFDNDRFQRFDRFGFNRFDFDRFDREKFDRFDKFQRFDR